MPYSLPKDPHRIRLLYLITCFGHGRGGHFYSIRTTAKALEKKADVAVVSLGPSESPVLTACRDYRAIRFRIPNLRAVIKLFRIVRKDSIEVIHSYDVPSFLFGRIVSLMTGVPTVHTKCGGAVPSRWYPHAENMIVYTKDDLSFFKSTRSNRATDIRYLPNRVSRPIEDPKVVEQIRAIIDPGRLTILRISRIGKYYEKTNLGSIQLVAELNERGIPAQLVLVGTIQDDASFSRIQQLRDQHPEFIKVFVEEQFTVDAARVIPIADAVVGTGRGAMEAVIAGKILLSPLANVTIPHLVDTENVSKFEASNFSERTRMPEVTYTEALTRVVRVFSDGVFKERVRSSMENFGWRRYSVDSVVGEFVDFYHSCGTESRRVKIRDLLVHGFFVFKEYISRFIRNLR